MVHYTEEAEHDLDEVATYTEITWGSEQRDWYLRVLERTCEEIIPANLKFGMAKEVPKRPGLLRWHAEHHCIYFRQVADGIEIVRIMHERMDPEHHV
jgi:toxin ParE1/3/4